MRGGLAANNLFVCVFFFLRNKFNSKFNFFFSRFFRIPIDRMLLFGVVCFLLIIFFLFPNSLISGGKNEDFRTEKSFKHGSHVVFVSSSFIHPSALAVVCLSRSSLKNCKMREDRNSHEIISYNNGDTTVIIRKCVCVCVSECVNLSHFGKSFLASFLPVCLRPSNRHLNNSKLNFKKHKKKSSHILFGNL